MARTLNPARLFARIDIMARLLALAVLLASLFPATGKAHEIASMISNAGIFVLFLLNGLRLSRDDVLNGAANWRFLLPLVLWCFGAMALAGLGFSQLASATLPASVALGFIFLGALPSTVQSATAYSSLAGGNVALSVISAALLNILGVFITMPIFALLAGGIPEAAIGDGLLKIALILLLPFAIGQLLQHRLGGWITAHKPVVSWADRLAIAFAVYVAFSGAVAEGIWRLLGLGAWAALLGAIAAFLAFGFGGAWILGRALKQPRSDQISFMFAGAQKSTAMGAPMAMVVFGAESAGLVMVPLLIYHLLQLVISAPIAQRLAAHNTGDR